MPLSNPSRQALSRGCGKMQDLMIWGKERTITTTTNGMKGSRQHQVVYTCIMAQMVAQGQVAGLAVDSNGNFQLVPLQPSVDIPYLLGCINRFWGVTFTLVHGYRLLSDEFCVLVPRGRHTQLPSTWPGSKPWDSFLDQQHTKTYNQSILFRGVWAIVEVWPRGWRPERQTKT